MKRTSLKKKHKNQLQNEKKNDKISFGYLFSPLHPQKLILPNYVKRNMHIDIT